MELALLSDEEFDAEMEKGFTDIAAGRVRPVYYE